VGITKLITSCCTQNGIFDSPEMLQQVLEHLHKTSPSWALHVSAHVSLLFSCSMRSKNMQSLQVNTITITTSMDSADKPAPADGQADGQSKTGNLNGRSAGRVSHCFHSQAVRQRDRLASAQRCCRHGDGKRHACGFHARYLHPKANPGKPLSASSYASLFALPAHQLI
jgi:hypothetical protein